MPHNLIFYLEGFHEAPGTRLGDGAEVVDKVSLGHTNASINQSESVVILVGNDGDLHILLRLQHSWVC